MDYIALNHQAPTPHPRGVFYNYERKIGGVRYYQESKSRVTEEAEATVVTVKPPQIKKRPVRLSYKKTREKIDKQEQQEQQTKLASRPSYIIDIKGRSIDFGLVSVRKALLSNEEKAWLAEAQHYFLTVKEDDKAIGSAKDYTDMAILEALWSTALAADIDPKRFLVQMFNESRFDPYARGKAGERGIGQFKRTTAEQCGYSWRRMTEGINGFAYQARAAAEFIKNVGEVAYNGKGPKAELYQNKISSRVEQINLAQS